jgi:methyl-accepting chemotaxis protein
MNKLNLKTKLAAGFGVLQVILAVTSAASYFSIVKLSRFSAVADQNSDETYLVRSIDSIINDQKAQCSAFLRAGKEEEMARFAQDNRLLAENFTKLETMLTTEDGKRLFARFHQASNQYHAILEHAAQLQRGGKQKKAVELAFSPEASAARDDLAGIAEDEIARAQKLRSSARAEQAAAESTTTKWTLALAILGTVMGFATTILIGQGVAKSVTTMTGHLGKLAANDLAFEDMEITTEDEIGKAGRALNGMKNNLRQLIQSIAGTAEHVASASEEISASASQQAQGAETQQNQTAQIATAMQEMSSTVLQVSESSNKAAEASRQAAETARQGGAIVEDTLAKMHSIAESVAGTARKMEELGKSSDQIGRIAGVIDDIADQTNLLALNAAIEAARAGEQGRGFAVVADEVRKLAERTTTATKEIAQMIKTIQGETKAAVSAMEAGIKQVEDGVKSTTQAGDSLKQIILMSDQVGEMITHIATAATEQSSASEEINQNMDQIAKLVRESTQGAHQSAKACQDLSGLALDMQKLVENFKLGNDNARKLRDHGRGHDRSLPPSPPDPQERPKALAAAAH